MKLTGKCKVEFEKWFIDKYLSHEYIAIWQLEKQLDDSMQYGVLVDYFDSLGINISDHVRQFDISWSAFVSDTFISKYHDNGRRYSRTTAIEKANQIRNEQLQQ